MTRIPVDGDGSEGKFIKWNDVEPGTEFEGLLRGLRVGKFGPLVDLETDDGLLTMPAPIALERQLKRVRPGSGIVVVQGAPTTSEGQSMTVLLERTRNNDDG